MINTSPRNGAEFQCKSLKLNVDGDAVPSKYYICSNNSCSYRHLCQYYTAVCKCGSTIDWEVNLAMPQDAKQYKYDDLFLKRFMARLTITDDLQVMPVSAVESFSFFAKHGIADKRAPLGIGLSLFRENMRYVSIIQYWKRESVSFEVCLEFLSRISRWFFFFFLTWLKGLSKVVLELR